MPLQLARIRIERDDRIAIKIVSQAKLWGLVRRGVSSSPVREVEIRIVGPGIPYGGASNLPGISRPCLVAGLTGRRYGPESPRFPAGNDIEGGDEAAHATL